MKSKRSGCRQRLKKKPRRDSYAPRIDVVWFKRCNSKFIKFLEMFKNQGVLDPYKDIEKEIVIGFEGEEIDELYKLVYEDPTIWIGLD
ncbi:MAG: hypothetical protein QXL27_07780 [Candidatus Bathyarchaeia archaeon]